LNTLAAIARAG
jgi:hypothetical protein